MATGSEIVSKRRGLASYSEKEYGYGVVGEQGQCYGRSMRDGVAASVKSMGREKSKDKVHVHVEKKRKISANDWDKEDKDIRVSTNSEPCKAPSVGSVISSDPGSGGSTLTECSGTSPLLLPRGLSGNGGQEGRELEEDEFVGKRDIFTSRWASENNSPTDSCVSDDDDVLKRKELNHPRDQDMHMSSPECGEFLREVSDRYKVSEEEYTNELSKNDSLEGDEDTIGKLDSYSEGDVDTDPKQEDMVPKRRLNMLESCRSVFEYEKLNKINEGTYGVVYRAKDKQSGEIVALKKVKLGVERDGGFPLSSLREINILSSFDHPSIVNVKEVVMGDLDSVFMVMEYMEHDLKAMLDVMKHPFSASEVKCLMLQLLEGVSYLHDNWVLHRDLKSSNLLLDNKGGLKICDFGLSRQYCSHHKPYTPVVVTLWYRAPELLLGSKHYSTAIDMWSVGCIMAEMLNKEPLFQGKTEVDQLDKIFRTLGTPNDAVWPGLSKLPGANAKFVRQPFNQLRKKFPAASFTGSPVLSELGMDLMNKLLAYDPEKRITAEAALDHDWFREVPLPKCKELMPTFPAQNALNRGGKR